ncbi:MAG: tRNA 2-selenouridine(34) synthase MnmH [Bacillota bacterium]|nr:tRNA 2-selenouridine(34) synthase MnmH [Bacillota bacterium]
MLITRPYEKLKDDSLFIDVRSPKEHKEERIIESINIPLFTDKERAIVGTAYKQKSVTEARRLGVEIVSQKLPEFFEEINELLKNKDRQIAAYCARGGYRSTFFASAFSSIGMNIIKVDGGYKKYRKYIYENLPILNKKMKYIVIHGNTGVGKTEILKELEKQGEKILDFEGAANHRGSLLGGIGLGEPSTQKNFESKIFNYMDKSVGEYIFVEAESRRVGNVMVPKFIHEKMKTGLHIYIEADIEKRINVLREDYIQNKHWKEESINNIDRLKKYVSDEKIKSLKSKVEENNFDYVAKELMINYYDSMYQNKSKEYDYNLKLKNLDSLITAEKIIKWKNDDLLCK